MIVALNSFFKVLLPPRSQSGLLGQCPKSKKLADDKIIRGQVMRVPLAEVSSRRRKLRTELDASPSTQNEVFIHQSKLITAESKFL